MSSPRRHVVYTPLDEVVGAYRNPKKHARDLIAGSITRFGVVELPTVDGRTGRLVAGHGRLADWESRHAAGEKPPNGVDVDDDGRWLVPVVHGWSSADDAEAEAYVVISNSSSIFGGWDNIALADQLADVRDQDPQLLELTGYDDKFIAKYWEGSTDPWDKATLAGDADDIPLAPGTTCPACGHHWET